MRAYVVVFPGSNCDRDVVHSLATRLKTPVLTLWYEENHLPSDADLVVLPGGFSYGDYLRCGAMAATAPILQGIKNYAENGGLVLGICNGFQILTEARLLPGALLANKNLKFICRQCTVRVERTDTPFTSNLQIGQVLKMPIAHHEGLYFLPPEDLKRVLANRQVVFRYCSNDGTVDEENNPNGSIENIAGVVNERGNVLGLMPHPERASEKILGSEDGGLIWDSVALWLAKRGRR
ncbi:phosphoribosylformylglycinamidine synthase subunit I [Thermovirga lienii DSM 17291]|jgi:phosphoribosylformylglycinamidine synthase|uniref:Phosphoribosylformylglycinamidine synthase subunit PurQ n=1 Tax=Thermovirga lienii (strain ATCC BAA-1197 / DSM 17291 / Cas60314) TaxID=580340 RepID=G7V595_THELD|nr:phosphoribosylformylglycinamidine synthase I [Thermovirga lienii]AER66878.1 phosphoribosylformylglycinamidine synthase subunit I [Thermovirga lienii DSM 17291]MDN5318103.1 phosphoribosylformylglycinamidine synthase subunit PurQ / glutaminase [Thermovirga sp.]MDN5367314.1 phosphoribosylformylglycinamidine synthase subunit PurQ / glutaminase [Thermovirga sp.]HCD71951.1 phosphoribosylformylglycinamidine synthase I [Thermovirga lienii]